MEGMGSIKEIIIMVIMVAAMISCAAAITRIGFVKRFDEVIEAKRSGKAPENASKTFESFILSALVVGGGAMLILILKQFDVIDINFFPYMKKQ